MILACGSAQAAKRAGRQTALRPDWEQTKFQVMLCGLRGKFTIEPYRSLALGHPSTRAAPARPPSASRRQHLMLRAGALPTNAHSSGRTISRSRPAHLCR